MLQVCMGVSKCKCVGVALKPARQRRQQQQQQAEQPDKAVAGLLLFVLPTFVRCFPNDAQVSEGNAIN